MRHPIEERLEELYAKLAEESAGEDIRQEIRALELAQTDPEAHGFPWDSPSLEAYPLNEA